MQRVKLQQRQRQQSEFSNVRESLVIYHSTTAHRSQRQQKVPKASKTQSSQRSRSRHKRRVVSERKPPAARSSSRPAAAADSIMSPRTRDEMVTDAIRKLLS